MYGFEQLRFVSFSTAVLRQNMQYAYKPVSAGTKFQQAKKINLKFIDL